MRLEGVTIARAEGSFLFDTDGTKYIDLCMGYGSVALGHGYTPVINAVNAQNCVYASPGFVSTEVYEESKSAIETFVGNNYILHGYYPSGAVSIEFVLRLTMELTGRSGIISFEKNMHGKTFATSQLGFESEFMCFPGVTRLPLPENDSDKILDRFNDLVKLKTTACVLIEPVQMTGGGYSAADSFYKKLFKIAKEHGVLVVFDEILTGCYRSGHKFYFERLNILPDIVVAGKALANGYPVAAVLMKNEYTISKNMNPGGTYFNHPLNCKAVTETIDGFSKNDALTGVNKIEEIICKVFSKDKLRGCGAMWCVDVGNANKTNNLVQTLTENKIIVSYYGQYIRLLPAYTIDANDLHDACCIIKNNI